MHSAWLGAEQLALPMPCEVKACVEAINSVSTLTTALVSGAEETLAGARADLRLGEADAAGGSALDMNRATTVLAEPAGGGDREDALAVTPLPSQVTEPGEQ